MRHTAEETQISHRPPFQLLLVEDAPAHVELIRRGLESSADIHIATTRSLQEARDWLAAHPGQPDVVLADLHLPDGEGTALLPLGEECSYPIVIMTSQGDEQTAVEAMKAGALDYVVKSELLLTDISHLVQRVLREWQHILTNRQTLKALRESEERFRALVEHASDVICELTLDARFVYASPNCRQVIGYEPEELIGRVAFELVHPEDRLRVKEAFSSLMQGAAQSTYRTQKKNGDWCWLEATGQAYFPAPGEFRGVIVLRDVTERKQAEEEQQKLQAQLFQAQKMEALGTLAGGIAHDFNNILTTILGFSELLKKALLPGTKERRNVDEVLKAGFRAKDIVQQILTFSRPDIPERCPLDLQAVVAEALVLLRAMLPSTLEIRSQLDSSPGRVLANPTQLYQVLMNLGINAKQAMPSDRGVLDIGLRAVEVEEKFAQAHALKPGPHLCLSVSDTGCGIEAQDIPHIFEPFFSTKPVGEGSGLGLSVVHGIVTGLGGAITLDSRPGQGTTFHIYFPLMEAAEIRPEVPDKRIPHGSGRVLFVDDEESITHMAEQMLQELGYEAVVASSGVEALELFRRSPQYFDVVLTDHTMPGMTGEALSREISYQRPDLPVILCTGAAPASLSEQPTPGGWRLLKPFSMETLGHALSRVLGTTQEDAAYGTYSDSR